MSIFNTPWDYSQPSFYKFSSDSVDLADFVANDLERTFINPKRVLDAFSGCGVVGLELLQRLYKKNLTKNLKSIDFCERESQFREFYLKNMYDSFSAPSQNFSLTINFHNCDMLGANLGKFDLIVANPPYFEGLTNSKDVLRNSCRHMEPGKFNQFAESIKNHLSSDGVAYFALRNSHNILAKNNDLIGCKIVIKKNALSGADVVRLVLIE